MDLDWSGRAEIALYPAFVSPKAANWPVEGGDPIGQPILQGHDTDMMKNMLLEVQMKQGRRLNGVRDVRAGASAADRANLPSPTMSGATLKVAPLRHQLLAQCKKPALVFAQ